MKRTPQWLAAWWARRLPPQSSLELRQNHIFIVPTLSGYAFAAALLIMLLVAINYQNSLAYGLTFLLGSMGLLTALHTWRNLAGLRLTGLPAEPRFSGQQVAFPVVLQAEKREYQAIALGWRGQPLTRVDVAQQGATDLRLTHLARQRGVLHAPRIRVETRFPLGIWVAWSWVDLNQRALVYPKPIKGQLDTLTAATGEDQDIEHSEARAGVDDYQGLAAWQPGDSLRRVNWKVWSKGQGLWVKQFAELQGAQSELDFNRLSGDVEHRLSVLCAQVMHLSEHAQAFSLQLPGHVIAPGQGPQHQAECLAALALYGVVKDA